MRAPQALISFLDIGRRLNSIGIEYDTLEAAQMAMPEGSEEYSAAHAKLVALTDEQAALQDLALVMQARTLTDAAVQLGVLSDAVAEVCVPDLSSLVQSGDLAHGLARFRRVLAGITPVVAGAAGLDRNQGGRPGIDTGITQFERPADQPMIDDSVAPDRSVAEVLPLCGAYHALNELRADIDHRIVSLAPDDSCRDGLWSELETVLTRLGYVVDRLAKTRATHIAELRAKATALATLLRSDDAGHSSVIPKDKSVALALSLAKDVIGLSES